MADNLNGYRVLVVEDNFFVADDMRTTLEEQGAAVIGPAPTVARALDLLEEASPPDVAVLDINLRDDLSYPVADTLRAWNVPERDRDVTFCGKPAKPEQVAKTLLSLIEPA